MTSCSSARAQFSEYLDGTISGTDMQSIAAHLQACEECSTEFAVSRNLQALLASIGPVKPPSDLSLRLRVAVSQEQAYTMRRRLDRWQMSWENTIAPVLARGAAGLASAVILLSAVTLMIGTVAAPTPVAANQGLVDTASSPQFLYTAGGTDPDLAFRDPVLIEAQITKTGKVYDYRIVSGPASKAVREELNNILLMSHFTPALSYGTPVPSRAILSFSGVSVRG